MTIVDLIRNTPPEYPWEDTARQKAVRAVNLGWRGHCWLMGTSVAISALADTVQPKWGSIPRDSIKTNAGTARDWFRMAVKG